MSRKIGSQKARARDGLGEFLIHHEVHAGRRFGIESAELFEAATRARFKAFPTAAYAVLDGRVITNVEMKKRPLLESPPVAAV